MENQPIEKGRRIFTPEQRAEFVRGYQQSGLRQQEFAMQAGISLASLSNWLRRERRKAKAKVQKPRFAEVVLPATKPESFRGWQLEVVSPRNWTVRLAQSASGKVLRELLESLPC